MRTLEISKHKFERHQENPRRFYLKTLSHGLTIKDRFKHRKILWIGLWFWELRCCFYSTPN